jgi:hypothetical protein
MTNTSHRPTPSQIQAELRQFIGTENYYRHSLLRSFVYTDGLKYMAEICGAYWLIDAILSYQSSKIIRTHHRLMQFQFWRLKVNLENHSAVLSCEDGDGTVVLTQELEFTDFPLAEFTCYLINRVMLLPSEY